MEHDHQLYFIGLDQGFPSWGLECTHDPDDGMFHVDLQGDYWEECLVQSWWDNNGIELVTARGDHYDESRWHGHGLKLWTSWSDFEGTPTLDGINEHQQKEQENGNDN